MNFLIPIEYGNRDRRFLDNVHLNYRKSITFIDESVNEYDEDGNLPIPRIIEGNEMEHMVEQEPDTKITKITLATVPKKYKKRRIPISERTKQILLEERGNLCELCKTFPFQQYHHFNEDPSDNRTVNIILLCYECHKLMHRKVEVVIR